MVCFEIKQKAYITLCENRTVYILKYKTYFHNRGKYYYALSHTYCIYLCFKFVIQCILGLVHGPMQ